MTKARKRILIALILSLVTFLATFSALRLYTSGAPNVVVSVQPPDSTWQVDSFFDIYLALEDWPTDPLDAFRIYVDFEQSLMSVMGVSPGPVVPAGDLDQFGYYETPSGIAIEDFPGNGIHSREKLA